MNKIKILNTFLNDKRIILLIILTLLLFVFVVLEVSILDQGKVTRNIYEAKREASERAGRILRAERAESAQKLKEKIRLECDDYKQGIYSLIAKSKNITPGNYNDDIIDKTIQSALEEFKKIGWITLEKDEFHTLPAFDRLIKVYEEYIINIDETLNELK